MRNNLNLAIARLRDLDGVAEVTDTAVDLDLLVQELLEGGDVEDLVAGGLRGIDDELRAVRTTNLREPIDKGKETHLLGRLGGLALGDCSLLHHGLTLAYCFTP